MMLLLQVGSTLHFFGFKKENKVSMHKPVRVTHVDNFSHNPSHHK